jgi:spore maturation protein CgeB
VLYETLPELKRRFSAAVERADVVIVGSYVPDGIAIGDWVTQLAGGVTAFYDIDTPVTLARLADGGTTYITPELIGRYDLYLSFTGGPTLERLERELGSPCARPLYCSVDATTYRPGSGAPRWDLGYMGTYSDDRQSTVGRLLLEPARRWKRGRFTVAGPQYPAEIEWPPNVERTEHLPPSEHRAFYTSQRFTLNVTRADMIAAGHSPSVRLFEAAACAVPIISDSWPGLDELFVPGREILIARSSAEVLHILREMPEEERCTMGARARGRVIREHTAAHRAAELEGYIRAAVTGGAVI